MRKWCGWLLVGLVVVVMFTRSSSAQETGLDAPYLYYYSDVLNAFVIERADGADSRVFGDGLMPEGTNTVGGPGWSPSGEWFAWTSGDVGGYGEKRRGFEPEILSADGQQQIAGLEDFTDSSMVWSPIDDLLLIAGKVGKSDPLEQNESAIMRIALINPSENTVIGSVETNVYGSGNFGVIVPFIRWTNDGKHAFAYYVERVSPDAYEDQATIYVFDTEGNVSRRVFPIAIIGEYPFQFGSLSPTGHIVYQSDDESQLIVESLITREQRHYTGEPVAADYFYWNYTGEYALTTAGTAQCDSSTGQNLWFYSSNTSEFRLIGDVAVLMVEWLVNDRQAIFIDCDWNYFVFDTVSGTISEFASEWEPRLMCLRTAQRFVLTFDENSDTNGQSLQLFDCDESSGRFVVVGDVLPPQVRISINGRYLGFIEAGSPVIYDTLEESRIVLPPDGRSYGADQSGEVIWHETADWMITWRRSSRAGGGGGPDWSGVTNSDSSSYRNLSECGKSPTCIGWLPSQVTINDLAPGQATSVLPVPNTVLKGSDWSFYVEWSPDGQQLAFGKTLDGNGSIAVVVLQTQQVATMFDDLTRNQGINWVLGNDGTYSAQIVEDDGASAALLATSPDGNFVVMEGTSADIGSGLGVYDANTGEALVNLGSYAYPRADFSPNGQLLVVSGPYERTTIWDTTVWEKLAILNTNGTAVAFSPDGAKLAVASSWDIQIWEVAELLA